MQVPVTLQPEPGCFEVCCTTWGTEEGQGLPHPQHQGCLWRGARALGAQVRPAAPRESAERVCNETSVSSLEPRLHWAPGNQVASA